MSVTTVHNTSPTSDREVLEQLQFKENIAIATIYTSYAYFHPRVGP